MIKKIARYLLLTLAGIFTLLIVFILVSVAPVDRTPAHEFPFYKAMTDSIEALDINIPPAKEGFSVGFGKVNITPSSPVTTAGYLKRGAKPYRHVHDSIFVRAMVVTNGTKKAAIVSADLLIMPPTVTRVLGAKLREIGFSLDNTYLAATHSHNSIGHWGEGATRIIYGSYEDSIVQFIADGIIRSIATASADIAPATIRSGSVAIPRAVENRLIDDGPEDPWLRVIEVHRSDSTKAVLMSYAAHATCLSSGTLELSRDYPGQVVDELEKNGYDFAMFLAGSVGSHRGSAPENDWSCTAWMARQITETFFSSRDQLPVVDDSSLFMTRVPLPLSDPQVKLSKGWKLRSWVFRWAFGEYDAFLTALRIGDIVMLGTPCDFSGEFSTSLDSVAAQMNIDVMVTSFNGGYIGYVTPGKYYDIDHYETRLMNWYAPGTGEYIRNSLKKLMVAVNGSR